MQTFEHNGRTFTVRIEHDGDLREPWTEHDGHGIVSDWTRRGKQPGERVLVTDRGSHRYYDIQASMDIAVRDGWDAAPYGEGTPRERAARAVEADFQRLRAWCNGDWYWIGVVVHLLCPKCGGEHPSQHASLWGIESDAGEYLNQVARELAAEIAGDEA